MSSPYYRNVNGLSLAFLAFDDVTQPIDIEAAAAEVQTAKTKAPRRRIGALGRRIPSRRKPAAKRSC